MEPPQGTGKISMSFLVRWIAFCKQKNIEILIGQNRVLQESDDLVRTIA